MKCYSCLVYFVYKNTENLISTDRLTTPWTRYIVVWLVLLLLVLQLLVQLYSTTSTSYSWKEGWSLWPLLVFCLLLHSISIVGWLYLIGGFGRKNLTCLDQQHPLFSLSLGKRERHRQQTYCFVSPWCKSYRYRPLTWSGLARSGAAVTGCKIQ